MSMLHAEGRELINAEGFIVHLKGVNKRSFVDHPFSHWQTPQGGTEWNSWNPATVLANFDAMKHWGINAIRFMPSAQYWIQNTLGHRDVVNEFLQLALNREQYAIMSFWNVLGATGQSGLPYPPYSQTGASAIIPSKAAFVDLWRSVARELKDYPNILFSLWNEAGSMGNQSNLTIQAEWFDVTQQCIDAIRAEGAKQPIVVQWATGWANISSRKPDPIAPDFGQTMFWSTYYPLNDPQNNLVYEFHNYFRNIHKFVDGTKVFCYTTDDIMTGLDYMAILQTLEVLDKPVLLGEIGVGATPQPNELEWFTNYLQICLNQRIHFCVWWWWWGGRFPTLTTEPNYQPNAVGDLLITALEGEPFPPTCTIDNDCPVGYKCVSNSCIRDIPNPEDITDQPTCEANGYFWYTNACHREPQVQPPIRQTIAAQMLPIPILLAKLWKLRKTFIREDIHRKIHPIV